MVWVIDDHRISWDWSTEWLIPVIQNDGLSSTTCHECAVSLLWQFKHIISLSQFGFKYVLPMFTRQIIMNGVNQKSQLYLNDRARFTCLLCSVSALQRRKQKDIWSKQISLNNGALARTLTWLGILLIHFHLNWNGLCWQACRRSASAKSICTVMICLEWTLHRHLFPWIALCFIFYFITLLYPLT